MPITPYLYYGDLAAAMRFLSQAFGFKKYGRPGDRVWLRDDLADLHDAGAVGAEPADSTVDLGRWPSSRTYRSHPLATGQAPSAVARAEDSASPLYTAATAMPITSSFTPSKAICLATTIPGQGWTA